ncbi:MAG: VOC family protein [Ectothiorhodospiraceae bacterium]|jgi:PhnB protein
MNLTTYLMFNGNCEEAFRFYAHCLGGEIVKLLRFGESPGGDDVSAEWHDKVMHACLRVGDNQLMASDCPPEYREKRGGYSVALAVDTHGEAERIFEALSAQGTVRMPIQETFWAERFGMVVDCFGTSWMVSFGGSKQSD